MIPSQRKSGDGINYIHGQPDLGAGKERDVNHAMHNSAEGWVKDIGTCYYSSEIRVHKAMPACNCMLRVWSEITRL